MRLPEAWLTLALRVLVYMVLALGGFRFFALGLFILTGNQLVAATVATLLAGTVANAIAMRIYQRAHLADIGLAWNAASVRNLLLGLAGGVGAAALVLGLPLAGPAAELEPVGGSDWSAVLTFFVLIMFGAIGEEMMFRGYGFQLLLAKLGPFATILPFGVLFSLAHTGNLSFSLLGALNTAGWGVLLGYALWRSGDLWLPIGLHVGWNWTLPLLGANLSGLKMNVTGYAMRWHTAPLWSGGDYGPEGSLLTSGIIVVLFVFLWKAPVRRQTPLLLRPRAEA